MSNYLSKIIEHFPVVEFIEMNYPFTDDELLYLRKHNYDLAGISTNANINWNVPLLEKLTKEMNWFGFSANRGVLWDEIAPVFQECLDWNLACHNDTMVWKHEYLEKYAGQIDWDWICYHNLKFTEDLLFDYRDRWDWWRLSNNEYIPWTEQILDHFAHRWDWSTLSHNPSIPFSHKLMKKFSDRWIYSILSMNTKLITNENLPFLKQYADIEYDLLSFYKPDFTEAFIEVHKDLLDWKELSRNEHLPWSLSFIENYKERWHFNELSDIPNLPWTIDFIEQYENLWNWGGENPGVYSSSGGISSNEGIPWSFEFIERYKHRLSWGKLVPDFEESEEGVESYIVKDGLARLTALEWTVEKMAKYARHLNADFIPRNPNYYKAIEKEVGKENVFDLYLALV